MPLGRKDGLFGRRRAVLYMINWKLINIICILSIDGQQEQILGLPTHSKLLVEVAQGPRQIFKWEWELEITVEAGRLVGDQTSQYRPFLWGEDQRISQDYPEARGNQTRFGTGSQCSGQGKRPSETFRRALETTAERKHRNPAHKPSPVAHQQRIPHPFSPRKDGRNENRSQEESSSIIPIRQSSQ